MNEAQLLKSKIDSINEKQHKKGKLYRGANFTAYNRSNLGSIPSSVENVIFKRPKEDYPEGFLKKSQRFANVIPTIKVSFSNKDSEASQMNYSKSYQNLTNNQMRYSNQIKSKYFGGENRFEQLELIKSKYSPGPGEYSPIAEVNKSYRYQSIFADKKGHPLPQKEGIKEPESYLPEKEKEKEMSASERKSVFIAKAPRFNYKERDDQDDISGPGFFEFASTFDVKQKGQLSSFFKGSVKPENPMSSQFITALQYSHSIPSFNTERKNLLKPIKSNYNRLKPFQEIKEEKINESKNIKEKRGPNYYLEQKIKFAQMINMNNANHLLKEQKTIVSCLPKVPKSEIIDNKTKHVPGPCYYDPIDIRTRKYFHLADPKVWI